MSSNPNFRPRIITCRNCGAAEFIPRGQGSNRLDPSRSLHAVSCAGCGLCFLNPQYPPEAYEYFYTHTYFDEADADYVRQSKELTQDYRAAVGPILDRFLRDFSQDKVFGDIGAGSGTWLEIFKSVCPSHPNRNIVAIEPSETACADLRQRFPDIFISPTVLERTSLPPGAMDIALCSALIEHFCDPLKSLLYINRLLVTDGLLIMLTPSLEVSALRRGAERFFKFVHTFYFTQGTLDSLANKAGFALVHAEVVPPQPDSLLWFPLLVTVHKKDSSLAPGDAMKVRKPSSSDSHNLRDADELFGRVHWAFFREAAWRSLRRAGKRFVGRFSKG